TLQRRRVLVRCGEAEAAERLPQRLALSRVRGDRDPPALASLLTLDRIAGRLEVSLFDLLVQPGATERDTLIELSRRLSKAQLTQLLSELSQLQPNLVQATPAKLRPIRSYPSLEVAAGWALPATPRTEPAEEPLRLPGPFDGRRDFAVRASGDSMTGFRSSIHDCDWLVMRKTTVSPDAVMGQIVLLLREDRYGDKSLHLKRIAQQGKRIYFRSDEPTISPIPATESDVILATLVRVIAPEALAPPPHTRLLATQYNDYFGFTAAPSRQISRIDGHLFFLLRPRDLRPKAALPINDCVPRPAEAAYVLLRDGEHLEYCGLARFDAARSQWRMRDPAKRE
ncbi:MAG TPA: S24 family peptidase, partial [Polyangiaceae bacterium]